MDPCDKYPVNIEGGIELIGDLEMFKLLLSHYEENLTSNLQKIYEAIKIQDWENVQRESHCLKGASG